MSESVEVSGVVKWYDSSRGYGFVARDDGGEDVLLHTTALKAIGIISVMKGSRVLVTATRRAKGWQASAVREVAEPTKSRMTCDTDFEAAAVLAGEWEPAMVKWFNKFRGYGFLHREGKADVFVHQILVARRGLVEFRPATLVEVRAVDTTQGPIAADIRGRA